MDNQKHLLALKSEDSLNLMLGSANNLRYPVHGLKATNLESLGTTKTKIKLTARERAGSDDPYRITGSTDFTYQRLDISDYFNGLLDTFKPDLPCTTQVFLNEITRLTGLEFEINDFEHFHITRDNAVSFKIKAKSESLRWVGEIDLSISTYPNISLLPSTHLQFDTNPASYKNPQLLNPFVNLTGYQLRNYIAGNDSTYPPVGVLLQNVSKNQRLWLSRALFHFGINGLNETIMETINPPFELYNSYIVDYKAQPSYNPFSIFSDEVKYAIHLKVDLNYWKQSDCEDIYLWYAEHELKDLQIDIGAAIYYNGLSGYDGSLYSSWFHSLQPDTFIASKPSTASSFLFDPKFPDKRWILRTDDISVRNFFMAFVRYNGVKRVQDNNSIYPQLTKVTEWIVNPQYCYTPIGNIKIYYD